MMRAMEEWEAQAREINEALTQLAEKVRGRALYYSRQGEPITMWEWIDAFDRDRVVRQEYVGTAFVSTVWIGLDHGFGRGRPLIFETMVFDRFDIGNDEYMARYATEQEAIAGHEDVVRRLTLVPE